MRRDILLSKVRILRRCLRIEASLAASPFLDAINFCVSEAGERLTGRFELSLLSIKH